MSASSRRLSLQFIAFEAYVNDLHFQKIPQSLYCVMPGQAGRGCLLFLHKNKGNMIRYACCKTYAKLSFVQKVADFMVILGDKSSLCRAQKMRGLRQCRVCKSHIRRETYDNVVRANLTE